MRTSTSRTAWSCSRPTTPTATRRSWRFCKGCFPAARSSGSTAPTWSGAWAPSTASRSSGRRSGASRPAAPPASRLLPGSHQRRAPAATRVHPDTRDVQLVLGAADDVARVGGLAGAAGGIGLEDQGVAGERRPTLHVHAVGPAGGRQHELQAAVRRQLHLDLALPVKLPFPAAGVLCRLSTARAERQERNGGGHSTDAVNSGDAMDHLGALHEITAVGIVGNTRPGR